MRIAVVTDSIADIPTDLAAANHILVIPAILVFNGYCLKDGPEITRESFYRQLPTLKIPPTTATPSSVAYTEAYQHLQQAGYDHVVSIHAASTLSGIYQAAMTGAADLGDFVHVVDSSQLSMGVGFQALAAAEAAKQGAGLKEVIAAATETRTRIRVMAMLDTMEYARRSGRVSWAQANLAQILRVKPFIALQEGKLYRKGEARTRQKGIHRLHKFLSDLGPLERLAILHTNPETDAMSMVAKYTPLVKQTPLIVQVTTIIGTHVGPNALGFAAVVR